MKAIIRLEEENPFLAVTVSASNLQIGIKTSFAWTFSDGDLKIDLFNYNKIILSAAGRHDNSFYISLPSFFMEFPENNLAIFGNYFSRFVNSAPVHYALAFFARNTNDVKEKIRLPVIQQILNQTTFLLQSCLRDSEQLVSTTPIISMCCSRITQILNTGFDFSAKKINFYPEFFGNFMVELLSSHLQTQMTTIIESKDYAKAKKVFDFLSIFMLKNQLKLTF